MQGESSLPDGFRYKTEFIDRQSETHLAALLETLELKPFEFHDILATGGSPPLACATTMTGAKS